MGKSLTRFELNFNQCLFRSFCIQNKNFFDIFMELVIAFRNNSESVCTFLSRVIESPLLAQTLQTESSVLQLILITNWTRLLVAPDISETSLQTLTSNVCPFIEPLRSSELSQNCDPLEVFTQFVKNLMNQYSTSDVNHRIAVIESAHKYLNQMIEKSEEVIQSKNFGLVCVKRIYILMSTLVSIGSPLLFIPLKADCLLSKIIDSIVVPTNLTNDIKQQMIPIFQKVFPSVSLCHL